MSQIKGACPNCHAEIPVDSTKDADICPRCGKAFIVAKAIGGAANGTAGGSSSDFVIYGGVLEKYTGSATDVVIPDNVQIIRGAFAGYIGITSVTIPSSVRTIGDAAFEGCESLREINIPNSVQTIGTRAFQRCESLRAINIPSSIQTTGDSAFSQCVALEVVDIQDGVQYIGEGAFVGYSSLKTINIPSSVRSIGSRAFNHCSSLKTINIPDSVRSIGVAAFCDCTSLESIHLPSNLEKIEFSAFCECKLLRAIEFPETLKEIGRAAFNNCSSLEAITIPASVESINNETFANCSSLREVVFMGESKIHYEAFLYCPIETVVASEEWKKANYSHFKCLSSYDPQQSSSGCYIATCVYGSYDCPPVWTLRRFRDNTLAATWYGRAFIHAYYAISPSLVRWFGQTEWFRNAWKPLLDCMVKRLKANGVSDVAYDDKMWS